MAGKDAFINEGKPRFVGSEIFGDGDCPNIYLGDTIEQVLPQVASALEAMGDDPHYCDPLRIGIKIMSDLEVKALKEL